MHAKVGMRAASVSSYHRLFFAVFLMAVVVLPSIAVGQPSAISPRPPQPRTPDHWAYQKLCEEAGDYCQQAHLDRYGFSLIQYPRPLKPGDRVQLYRSKPGTEPLVCRHLCSLYFLDLMPGAHFAHPTVVGIYDWETSEFQAVQGEWWPVVNNVRPVFDTVYSRVTNSIDERPGLFGLPQLRKKEPPTFGSPAFSISPPEPGFGQSALDTAPPCNVHALVVNGYNDPDDTFDEDTDGIYAVLRGLGVPDDQIVFVSPIDSPWRDYATTSVNIKAAIGDIASAVNGGGGCSEFVLLISSHGDEEELDIRPRRRHHEFIESATLKSWLEEIDGCAKWTVVVEACKGESLRDEIEAAAGAVPVRSFYSAREDDVSWGDIDDDDSNPDDLGSETIWGYVEAFGSSAADLGWAAVDPDGRLSFCEAVLYAKRNDASRLATDPVEDDCTDNKLNDQWNAVTKNAGVDTSSAHECTIPGGPVDVAITPGSLLTKRRKKIDGFGMSQIVKRCTNTPVWVTVHNQGDVAMPVGKLRLHGAIVDDDGVLSTKREPYANLALVGGLAPDERRTFLLRWGVRPAFRKNERVALFATFDSPQAPVWNAAPDTIPWQTNPQACQCEVSVIKRCFPIVGCDCREYAQPEVKLEAAAH